MRFEVFADRRFPAVSGLPSVILVPDGWNDFGFITMYDLWFRDGQGGLKQIGPVKIGRKGMSTSERPFASGLFNELSEDHFSLGQDDSYYEEIRKLGDSLRISILKGLRDIAFDATSFEIAISQEVTLASLLRSIEQPTVENQFRRISRGGSRLTDYAFRYNPNLDTEAPEGRFSKSLDFAVKVGAVPPTNLHVLVGRNGSGKTTILKNIAHSLVGGWGPCIEMIEPANSAGFTNCITVSFSAFDTFDLPLDSEGSEDQIGRAFIGLHPSAGSDFERELQIHHGSPLAREFTRSIVRVLESDKSHRWLRAIRLLQSDPHFEEIRADSLLEFSADQPLGYDDPDEFEEALEDLRSNAPDLFDKLSAGHKIVLLTVTRLVETVAEGSIVLLDEPETHLHPPLLAAFIRALSDLLINRNGVAIIATHSPVLLQEVPRVCVWKITGWNDFLAPERPTIETFGENVGILTHEIFGLEVMESGFHYELRRAVDKYGTYEAVLRHFGGQLGGEAKGLVRVLLASASRRQS